MAIKWGSTYVTAVKWGSTNCTTVYWGSTKVFPNSNAYNGSTFAYPMASGFTLWCYNNWDPDRPIDSLGKKKDVTSGGLNYSRTDIGKYEARADYRWISRNAINFTPYSKIIIKSSHNYYNNYENDRYWYACWGGAVGSLSISSCNSNVQDPTGESIGDSSISFSGRWPTGEYPTRDTWYDIKETQTVTLTNKPTSAHLSIHMSFGRNHSGSNGSTGTFYCNITSIEFQ